MCQNKSKFTSLFILLFFTWAGKSTAPLNWHELPITDSSKKSILENNVFVSSNMNTLTLKNKIKKQQLDFKIIGRHKKKCHYALKKISQYENYQYFISFIKKSTFDEKSKRVFFGLDDPLMPFKMSLQFIIPRIKTPGLYHFSFDRGLLKDLHGEIHITSHAGRCLFYVHARWLGPYTSIPDLLFELFSTTLGRRATEKLFKMSSFY